jgi:hypothetical protein
MAIILVDVRLILASAAPFQKDIAPALPAGAS